MTSLIEDFETWVHNRHHPETPAATATATAPTTEEHMSFITALHEITAEAEAIGEEVLGHAKVVASTPEGAELLAVARQIVTAVLAGHVAPATLTGALAGLKTVGELVQGYVNAAQAQQAQQAAGEPQAA